MVVNINLSLMVEEVASDPYLWSVRLSEIVVSLAAGAVSLYAIVGLVRHRRPPMHHNARIATGNLLLLNLLFCLILAADSAYQLGTSILLLTKGHLCLSVRNA